MAAYEVLLLNTAIPQIQAAQSGDTYVVPRDIAINATAIISANSATDALRITQTGAGNAILVEDSSNPDATPFVVTATGDVGIGTTSPFNPVGSGMTSLTVSGTTYGSLWIQANSAAVRGSFNVTSANNTVNLTAYTNHPLTFATDDKERGRFEAAGNFLLRQSSNAANTSVSFNTTVQDALTLDSSGNLGVGTTNPAVRLHVSDTPSSNNGTIQLGSAIYYGTIQHDAGVTGANIYNSQDNGGHLFRNSGSTVLTLNNSGNLGLGVTPSNWNTYTAFQVLGGSVSNYNTDDNTIYASNIYYGGSPSAFRYVKTGQTGTMYRQNTGAHTWHTTGTTTGTANAEASAFSQAMTLDASGNLGIGTTSPSNRLTVAKTSADNLINIDTTGGYKTGIQFTIGGTAYGELYYSNTGNGNTVLNARYATGSLVFGTGGTTERARITSDGDFNFGVAATNAGVLYIQTGTGVTTGRIIDAVDALGGRYFEVQTDGDVYNTNGTYGTISDQKLKQDIVDAGSQWADIKAIRFRKYRMKSDVAANPDAPALLGVIAQELEQVSPGLVDEHPDMETVEVTDEDGNVTQTQQPTGTTTKTVKSSILLMKAAVALQEAMARIEKLESEVAALKGA